MFVSKLFSPYIAHSLHKSKMSSTNLDKLYETAISLLNGLQTNAAVIEQSKKEGRTTSSHNVFQTELYLNKIGIQVDDLNKLNVIHVSGTKGKGSTCAFAECILRKHGLKTGFFSSPHLISVRERIRVNGVPLTRSQFSHYFLDVYYKLDSQKSNLVDMPAYFKFLTVLAYKVFLEEKVDVAIVEVGIGGLYDCTNIISRPTVCGITSLGYDHMSLLGDTLSDIARHKAGIIKSNVPVYTVPQPKEAYDVLAQTANELKCNLYMSPDLREYHWQNSPVRLGLEGRVQEVNASLGVQLALAWLNLKSNNQVNLSPHCHRAERYELTPSIRDALYECNWPGRNQRVEKGPVTYFIDGAHTTDSIQQCLDWFENAIANNFNEKSYLKVLVFNCTGDRKSEDLLRLFAKSNFDLVCFSPNFVSTTLGQSDDNSNFMTTINQTKSRLERHLQLWNEINEGVYQRNPARVFNCLESTVYHLEALSTGDNLCVLVTGSLHLVGGVLTILNSDSRRESNCNSESWKSERRNQSLDSK